MADDRDQSQQTEQPTSKRLDPGREQGDVIKSTEVSAWVLLAGGTMARATLGKASMTGMAGLLQSFLEQPDTMAVDGTGLIALMRGLLLHLAYVLAPLFGVLALAAVAGHVLQNRPGFAPSRLMPDFSKVSPLSGFKRLFGLDGWMNLLKGL